jgi:DnaD/phage-associated family protein
MTPPMIMKIIDYCVDMDKKSMRYVEKTALAIYDDGIETYEALEEYFEKKKKAKSEEGIVRNIIGIGERNFTTAEKVHIAKWFDEYKSSKELITLAFEKTVASISKPSVPYMSKLLQRWSESGYKTAADVENGKAQGKSGKNIDLSSFDEAIPAVKKEQNTDSSALDLEDFFENG